MACKVKLIVLLGLILLALFGALLHFIIPSGVDDTLSTKAKIHPLTLNTKQKSTSVLRYDYAQLLDYSLLFYESMRSGKLPADNRVPWRGDSCGGCRGPGGEDLSGGYFSNGTFIDKTIYDNSLAVISMAWGIIESKEGYEAAGLLNRAIEAVLWGADYLMNVRINQTLYEVTSAGTEWTRPESVEDGYLATAALAATSRVVSDFNPDQSQEYLQEAKNMYELARSRDNSSSDWEMWAVIWLYLSETNEDHKKIFHERVLKKYDSLIFNVRNDIFKMEVAVGVLILSFEYLGKPEPPNCYALLTVKEEEILIALAADGDASRLGTIADMVALCNHFGEVLGRTKIQEENKFLQRAVTQVNLMLGDAGRSFVTAFGNNPPQRARHMASSCPDLPQPCDWNNFETANANPQKLYGALVWGPNYFEPIYTDHRKKTENNVAIKANAGFQSLLASLYKLHVEKKLPQEAYDCKISLQTDVFDVSIDFE